MTTTTKELDYHVPKVFYCCENGNDICIEAFDSFEEARDFALHDKRVKEIFKYRADGDDIDCLGCVWKGRLYCN
jgi:hypothetical protein